jgi:cell division transport system permease protein
MRSVIYFIKEALVGFKRNFSTALGSIITIFLSLVMIGLFCIAGVVVNNIVESVESEISITCYIGDNYTETSSDVTSFESWLKSLSGVDSVGFTTKDQALENFRQSVANPEIVDQLDEGSNPLPASVNITLTDAQLVTDIAGQIETNSTFAKICDNPTDPSDSVKYGQKTVERMLEIINYGRIIGIAVIILLVVIALIFINNTIRLAIMARRKEISIMRLVGASNGFIRGPFLTEAAIHSVIGSILAIVVLELVRQLGITRLAATFAWLPVEMPFGTVIIIYVALVIAGLIIGLFGSAFSMRRHLKV